MFEHFSCRLCGALVLVSSVLASAQTSVSHWQIQAVGPTGVGTHPLVGAPAYDTDFNYLPQNRVVLEGILINGANDLTDTSCQTVMTVQGEGADHAGTQAFAACFFQGPLWPDGYDAYFALQPGTRVRLEGFTANFWGKININERHSSDPNMNWTLTVLGTGPMPAPEAVPSCAVGNTFDQTRLTGGEWFQSRWVRMNSLTIVSGTWAADGELIVTDGTSNFRVKLSPTGDFGDHPAPTGSFDALGIFDQEPTIGGPPPTPPPPATGDYRLWVRRYSELIIPSEPPMLASAVSRKTHETVGALDLPLALLPSTPTTEPRGGGLSAVVLTFNESIQPAPTFNPLACVTTSAGQIVSVTFDGLEMHVELSGVPDGSCVTLELQNIVDLGGNPLAGTTTLTVRSLQADVIANSQVNIGDALKVKSMLGAPVNPATAIYDVNLSGKIDVGDTLAVKSRIGAKLHCF